MCGLVGIAGNLQYTDEVMMKRLFVFDYWRGTDSTGLAAINPKGEHDIVKRACNPLDLFDSKQFDKALDARKSWAFLGHNRAATLGAVNNENAHPFQYGDIIGAHNGTIDKDSWRRLEAAAGIETSVDSAAIFASINAIGIDDTIELIEHGKISATGAWALVWYDNKDQTLRFLKNEHRPLYLCVHAKGDRIAWASEWIMLRAAEEMTAGWETESNKKGYSYFPLEDDWLYEFPISDLMADFTLEDMLKAKTRQIKGREPAPVAVTTMGRPPFQQAGKMGSTTDLKGISTGTNIATSGGTGTKTPRVVDIATIEGDPFAGVISYRDFEQMSDSGVCSWCASDVNIFDEGLTIYADEDVVLCKNCTHRHSSDNKIYVSSSRMDMYA